MTTFNTSILVTADASGAKREMAAAEKGVISLGAAGKAAGKAAAGGLNEAEKAAARLARQNERAAGDAARQGKAAAASLLANFNDVGVTLAPGQSPLLIAVQQGSQISQALGSAGAGGAVKALGAAFAGLVSPVNLAIFGTIAGLGLITQGLSGLIGETRSVEDAIGDLDDATKAWREAASVGVGDLAREFGTVTPEIIEMQRQLTDLRLTELLLSAADAARTLGEALNPGNFELTTRTGKIADLLGVEERSGINQIVAPQVQEFDQLLTTLRTSVDDEEQIAALDRIQALILQAAGGLREMNGEQAALFVKTVELERQLQLAKAAQEGIGSAQQIASEKAFRMLATLRDEADIREKIALYGEDSREVAEARFEAERRTFEATLATLDVSDLMKRKLQEAWDNANGLQGSAFDALEAFLGAAGAGDEVKRAIADAWDVLTGAADATNVWAATMSGVAAEVRGIGAALASLGGAGIENASKAVELEALNAGKSAAEARRAADEADARRAFEFNEKEIGYALAKAQLDADLTGIQLDADLAAARKVASERERLAKGSASAGARQTDAGLRFIGSLQRELDILRATDPVQKEMIRNREALVGLTARERQLAEELIATRIRETEQQKQAQEAWDFAKNSAYDALDALIIQGEKASDVMANLAASIAKALLQSALLGTGPLAGIFGGQGSGLFGIIGEAIGIPGLAEGGPVNGPGGPRDDQVLTWLSNGEYVVNAAATARHRPLLEAINNAPRFASGGVVGSGAAAGSLQGGGEPMVIELRLSDDIDARIAETSRDVAVRVVRSGIQDYDAKVLPRRMRAVQADPRRVG